MVFSILVAQSCATFGGDWSSFHSSERLSNLELLPGEGVASIKWQHLLGGVRE